MIDRQTEAYFEAHQPKPATASTDHIRLSGNSIFCAHCGYRRALKLPIRISELTNLNDQFQREHGQCRAPQHKAVH